MSQKDRRYGILQPGDEVVADVFHKVGRIKLRVTRRDDFVESSQESEVELVRPGYRLGVTVPVAVVITEGYFRPAEDSLVKFVSYGSGTVEKSTPLWRKAIESARQKITARLRGLM